MAVRVRRSEWGYVLTWATRMWSGCDETELTRPIGQTVELGNDANVQKHLAVFAQDVLVELGMIQPENILGSVPLRLGRQPTLRLGGSD